MPGLIDLPDDGVVPNLSHSFICVALDMQLVVWHHNTAREISPD